MTCEAGFQEPQAVICIPSSHDARHLDPQRLYSHLTTLARIATNASVSIVYVPSGLPITK
jgi:hypothetical protein